VRTPKEENPRYKETDIKVKKFIRKNQGKHFCSCDCGQAIIIQKHHYYYGIPEYCYNHHSKKENNYFFNKHFYLNQNGNWHNGNSFKPYPLGWTQTFKEQIRYRDKYKCQLCGCPEVENNRRLDVHHIDYEKENINPHNLVSLCMRCHGKTNGNRAYYKEYFQKIIKNKEVFTNGRSSIFSRQD